MSKYTPGPWTIHPRIKDSVVSTKGGPIADLVGQKPGDVLDANARLIAAAPEMLEALKTFAKFNTKQGWPDDLNNAIIDARTVIAKASGGAE